MRHNAMNRANQMKRWHKMKEFRSQSVHYLTTRSDSIIPSIRQRSKSVKIMTNNTVSGVL